MKRVTRLLLLFAPLAVLLIGVPLGVSLAQRYAPTPPPVEPAGGLVIAVMSTSTTAPLLGPRAPTNAPRLGPIAPTTAPVLGPRAPTAAPRLGPAAPTPVPKAGAPTPLPTTAAQNGVAGIILGIEGDRLTVYTKAGRGAEIVVMPNTTIRLRNRDVRLTDLMVGDEITVLGTRDANGLFRAELIRAVRPDATAER